MGAGYRLTPEHPEQCPVQLPLHPPLQPSVQPLAQLAVQPLHVPLQLVQPVQAPEHPSHPADGCEVLLSNTAVLFGPFGPHGVSWARRIDSSCC